MPSVSVIIPTYNREASLPDAIDSVLQQTFNNFEVLVVDDGSTDNTCNIVSQIDDDRVNYYSHIRNKGGSAARNTGIEQASGKYLAFLDSDDEWLPSKLEKQVNCLESRSEEWVGVYCGHKIQRHGSARALRKTLSDLTGLSEEQVNRKEGGEELIKDALMTLLPTGGTSTLLVRADAAERIKGFDPEFQRHQDWEFIIRLLKIGKLAHVDNELVIKHDTPLPPATVIEDTKERYFDKFSEEIICAEAAGYDVTAHHKFSLSCSFFRSGNFSKGINYLDYSSIDRQKIIQLYWNILQGLWWHMRER